MAISGRFGAYIVGRGEPNGDTVISAKLSANANCTSNLGNGITFIASCSEESYSTGAAAFSTLLTNNLISTSYSSLHSRSTMLLLAILESRIVSNSLSSTSSLINSIFETRIVSRESLAARLIFSGAFVVVVKSIADTGYSQLRSSLLSEVKLASSTVYLVAVRESSLQAEAIVVCTVPGVYTRCANSYSIAANQTKFFCGVIASSVLNIESWVLAQLILNQLESVDIANKQSSEVHFVLQSSGLFLNRLQTTVQLQEQSREAASRKTTTSINIKGSK